MVNPWKFPFLYELFPLQVAHPGGGGGSAPPPKRVGSAVKILGSRVRAQFSGVRGFIGPKKCLKPTISR